MVDVSFKSVYAGKLPRVGLDHIRSPLKSPSPSPDIKEYI